MFPHAGPPGSIPCGLYGNNSLPVRCPVLGILYLGTGRGARTVTFADSFSQALTTGNGWQGACVSQSMTSIASAPRTLIADDQPDVLEALRLLLKNEGFQIESVNSPAAVLEKLKS